MAEQLYVIKHDDGDGLRIIAILYGPEGQDISALYEQFLRENGLGWFAAHIEPYTARREFIEGVYRKLRDQMGLTHGYYEDESLFVHWLYHNGFREADLDETDLEYVHFRLRDAFRNGELNRG